MGPASFVDAHTIQVGKEQITAGTFLINTGAQPRIPAIAGLDELPYLTYKQIFKNDRLPRRLIVVGGGPIGCEIAQSYCRLGAHVSLVAEALLPREEPEASTGLAAVFAAEGIEWVHGRATATCCSSPLAVCRSYRSSGLNAREFATHRKGSKSMRICAPQPATSTQRVTCWVARSTRIWRAGRGFKRHVTRCCRETLQVRHALCHVSRSHRLKLPGWGSTNSRHAEIRG